MRRNLSTLPNLLTLLRLAILPLLANFLIHAQGFLAWIVLVIAAFTDFLDGYLARKYKVESAFGKLMDPVADKIMLCVAVLCIVAPPNAAMSPWLAILVLSREFLIGGLRSFASSQGLVIGADKMGKTKTVLQIIGIGSMMLGLDFYPKFFLTFGLWVLWASVVLSYWSMVRYSLHAYLELKSKIN